MTFLAYLPVLSAGFIWDDDTHVTNQPLLATWDGLRAIWLQPGATPQYYPLTHSTFWLEYHLFALQPLGYHVVNVVLHTVNASLVWLVLERLAVPGAWLAAAVFALHPVQVETAAWITELKNLQSGLFYLLAMLAYLRFALPGPGAGSKRLYGAALLAFAGALLSKTVTSTLPAALLICLWWKRGRLERRDVLLLIPFFITGIACALVTTWLETWRVGAQGADWALSFPERCLVAGRALWFYAGKLVFPWGLTFIYPRWKIDATVWWQWLFPLAAAAVGAVLWGVRERLGAAPLAAATYFALTLAPALGFVDVYPFLYSFVADHFQYLASIGLIALLVGAATAQARRVSSRPFRLAGGAALLLALGGAAWQRTYAFTGVEVLWHDTLRKNPSAWLAYNNLGNLYLGQGKNAEAMQYFEKALQFRPGLPMALYNMGVASSGLGRLDEARRYYEETLRRAPAFAAAHNNLANVYLRQGRIEQAIEHYEKALALVPNYQEARQNLNVARTLAGSQQAVQ